MCGSLYTVHRKKSLHYQVCHYKLHCQSGSVEQAAIFHLSLKVNLVLIPVNHPVVFLKICGIVLTKLNLERSKYNFSTESNWNYSLLCSSLLSVTKSSLGTKPLPYKIFIHVSVNSHDTILVPHLVFLRQSCTNCESSDLKSIE